MRTFLFLAIVFWGSVGYTDEWVASVPTVVPSPPMVVETPVPVVRYVVPQPTVVYHWTPRYVLQPKRRCFFRWHYTYEPTVQWVYQPYYYRPFPY